MPAVLILHTHPYEGYHDGKNYYDPADGGLAQAQSPMDPEGTVALGAALTSYLRGQGVTVIHLRISVSPGETSSAIRERTETMIRHYCRLYPDIGLVLDLGRSAEMTEEGGILQTQAQYRGEACAQLRMTVSGSRPSDATGRDLAAALALRQALWEEEPALSRPVRVVEGGGLASELLDVRVLTLELGAAGNTYAQARALLKPLGDALCRILGNS
jgi:stage II sporulation protein P